MIVDPAELQGSQLVVEIRGSEGEFVTVVRPGSAHCRLADRFWPVPHVLPIGPSVNHIGLVGRAFSLFGKQVVDPGMVFSFFSGESA